MHRREFLAASAALAGAPLLARAQPADKLSDKQPEKPDDMPPERVAGAKRTLRKAVMIGMVGEGETLLDKFKILKDCGFEGVEMDSPSTLAPDVVLAAMQETGIKVHGIVDSKHWSFHLNSPEEKVRELGLEALRTCLRDGKKYGAVSVLLVPGVVNKDQPYDAAWRLSQEQIRKAIPLAEECRVKIAIENVWNNFLLSPLEAARYVDEFRSPWVGWHFDIGNVINYGWPDQWARILGPRITKLHIKDFSRKKRDDEGLWKGFNVELGDGDAGWEKLMKALDDTGYSTAPRGNWATAEVAGGNKERLLKISQQMDKLFAM